MLRDGYREHVCARATSEWAKCGGFSDGPSRRGRHGVVQAASYNAEHKYCQV